MIEHQAHCCCCGSKTLAAFLEGVCGQARNGARIAQQIPYFLAEQEFRSFKVKQKFPGSFRTETGVGGVAVSTSLIEMLRKRG